MQVRVPVLIAGGCDRRVRVYRRHAVRLSHSRSYVLVS